MSPKLPFVRYVLQYKLEHGIDIDKEIKFLMSIFFETSITVGKAPGEHGTAMHGVVRRVAVYSG